MTVKDVPDHIELAMSNLRVQDMEMTLLHAQQNFRNIISHARCYICSEHIDDARWFLGDMGDTQEIVHADCFDKTSKENPEEELQQRLAPKTIPEELPFKQAPSGDWPAESGDRTDFGFLLILPKNIGGEVDRISEDVRSVSTSENGKGHPDHQHPASREWTGEAEP